jgi:hypothetical protein
MASDPCAVVVVVGYAWSDWDGAEEVQAPPRVRASETIRTGGWGTADGRLGPTSIAAPTRNAASDIEPQRQPIRGRGAAIINGAPLILPHSHSPVPLLTGS